MNEPEVIEAGAMVRTESLDLGVSRPPAMVLDEARKAARALKDIVDAKPKPVMFGGERYLEFEDWQTVGRFYGITPRITTTRYVEYGEVRGFEALADAIHVPTGNVVSSAEAMCLNDEEKWSTRPKYEYHYVKKSGGLSVEDPGKDELIWEEKRGKRFPKRERVRVGDERVPLFQLRSMAQTRAGAKALRNALAWVVVLAGYKPTPAEEMPRHDEPDADHGTTPTVEQRADGSALVTGIEIKTGTGKTGKAWTMGSAIINEGQFRKFHAVARGHGWTEAEVHELLSMHGFASSKDITVIALDTLLDALKARTPEA